MENNERFLNENHMRFFVERLNRQEKAITLLYDAAACSFWSSAHEIWEGIKAQEEAVINHCQQERERLAAIIIADGVELSRSPSLPLPFEMWAKKYKYCGEIFRIEMVKGKIKKIKYCEE